MVDSDTQKFNLLQNIETKPVSRKSNNPACRGKEFTRVYKINGKKVCKRLFQRTSAGLLNRILSKRQQNDLMIIEIVSMVIIEKLI